MRTAEQPAQTRNLLAAMALLQMLWLVIRWLLGIPPNLGRIPILLVYTVIVGSVINLMPAGFVSRLRQHKERLVHKEKFLILTLCLVVLTLGVIYANYRVAWSGEESVFNASRIVAEEGVSRFFAHYSSVPWLGNQHPPLVPLVYGFTMHILGVNLLVIRLVSLVLTTATIWVTYSLASELYDRQTGFLAALLLVSLRYFLYTGTAASNDMPVTFFFTLALLFTVRLLRMPTYWLSVAAGIFIGAGLLSKYTMVLVYPVIFVYFAIYGSFKRLWAHCVIVAVVSAGILAAWVLYADHIGVFATQKETLVSYSKLVITTSYGKKLLLDTLVARLPSALGVYNIPMLVLGALHLARSRNRSDVFILLWIALVFLLLSFTLPENRYFMLAFPALAIVMARGLSRVPEAADRAVALALLYSGGALYLYIDWHREDLLFLP